MLVRIIGFVALSSLALLAGCSSKPTMGERMLGASAESAALAQRWSEGEEMMRKGRELIDDGEDRVEDGNDNIADGKRLIEKGRDAISKGEREQRDGAELVRRGQAAMQEAERTYAEKYPELYRQISLPK